MASIAVVDDALLTPQRLDDETGTATGAVYDAHGALVRASVRGVDRTDRWIPADPEQVPRPRPFVIGAYHSPDAPEVFIDEAVFGGYVMSTWGHLITESISTAWAASRTPPDAPLILVPWGRWWPSQLPQVQTLCRLAGWGNRPIVVTTGTTHVGRLHLPEQLINLDSLMHEGGQIPAEMNVVYDRVTGTCGVTPEGPIFLARPDGHRRSHPAEQSIADRLSAAGIKVVRGWDHSIEDQVRIAAGASALLGFSGSNLHNSVFAGPIPVIELEDERAVRRRGAGMRELQEALCTLRGQPHKLVATYSGSEPVDPDTVASEALAALEDAMQA